MVVSRIRWLLERVRELLNMPARLESIARQSHAEFRSLTVALKRQAHGLDTIRTRQSRQYRQIEHETRQLHDEVRDRLLQYHLQLGRLTSLIEGRTDEPQTYSVRIPLEVEPSTTAPPAPPADGEWLEIRSRAGTIAHGLRRLYGARVAVMPIFESQRMIVEELYGIQCSDLIDYDQFTIPFEGRFDLIVANHMLTHVVRLDRFFNEVRAHLRPGGHLYLYNELDDAFVFDSGKSIVNSLNPVHLQTFDRTSLMRLLETNGFDVAFIKRRNGSLLCIARYTGVRELSPMSRDERETRIAAYTRGRAYAILRAPEQVRPRFAAEWREAVATGVAAGIARFDAKGVLRVAKSEGAEAG